ncbi:HTH-type transcriptional regulator MalT [Candidatus Magnetaquicoccaceae bacterium FCR-1]|uniref:HTH-type transcriptional regulator MalT n=1 Tax=Candidatus Magnetaquiglobus chichijimensis TaxID=3141448 RepID=A0ABQ0C724_9PROT
MEPLPLTKRQIEILKLIQAGYSNKEVARRLEISDGTVKQHLVEIFRRLKVNNRTKAAQMVTRAEEEFLFLSPAQKDDAGRTRSVVRAPVNSALLQPLHCVGMRPHAPSLLLHRLGTEAYNRLNRLLRECCALAARRFEGVVQGSIEGPLVLFGARIVREDDALRAVCCAGMIMDELEKGFPELVPLADWVRVMVYSVQVVSSTDGHNTTLQGDLHHPDFTGSGVRTIGHGIHLSPGTAQDLDRLFARHGLISTLFPGCGVLNNHFHPVPIAANTPFVGRDTELDELHRRVAKLMRGDSESTLVVGEVGFGETRLVRQLRMETAQRKEILWLAGTCHTVARTIPLHPFVPILESLAQTDRTLPARTRWNHLEEWMSRLPVPWNRIGKRFLALAQETEPPPRMQQGDALHSELTEFLLTLFSASPHAVIVHIDNAQWSDPYSRLLLPGLAGRLNHTKVWLILSGRKAELRSLANHLSFSVLSLMRLPNRDILRLLKQMPVAKRLDAVQIDMLLEWSRGVPLFAVEIAQHLAGMKKSALQETIQAQDLFPESLFCTVMERLHALTGMDWKLIRALAASPHEVPMEELLAWNLHGDGATTEASVNHLEQAGLLRFATRGTVRVISFGNEMVRAAIRKTLPERDLR